MDLDRAYQILGVPKSASLEEVRGAYRRVARKFHPDVQKTGDSRKFVLVSAAYTLIRDHLDGRSAKESGEGTIPEEVVTASAVDERIDASFARIEAEYVVFRDTIVAETKTQVRSAVFSASRGSELKKIVMKRVLRSWTEMVSQIESYVRRLLDKAAGDDREFLFALFKDVYEARRQAWMDGLYRNPVIVVCVALAAFAVVGRAIPALASTLPDLFTESHSLWVPVLPLLGLVVYVIVQLWVLNPRNQFMPPRLSLWGVHVQAREIAKTVNPDRSELAQGGAVAGAILGTFILPGVGTAAGAGIGFVLGLLGGDNLEETKKRVHSQLSDEIDFGIRQLDSRLLEWIRSHKADLKKAARASLAANLRHVAKLLIESKGVSKRLAADTRLLLEGPGARG